MGAAARHRLPAVVHEQRDRHLDGHDVPCDVRVDGRLRTGSPEISRPRRPLHRVAGRDGGAGDRAADPQVPRAE